MLSSRFRLLFASFFSSLVPSLFSASFFRLYFCLFVLLHNFVCSFLCIVLSLLFPFFFLSTCTFVFSFVYFSPRLYSTSTGASVYFVVSCSVSLVRLFGSSLFLRVSFSSRFFVFFSFPPPYIFPISSFVFSSFFPLLFFPALFPLPSRVEHTPFVEKTHLKLESYIGLSWNYSAALKGVLNPPHFCFSSKRFHTNSAAFFATVSLYSYWPTGCSGSTEGRTNNARGGKATARGRREEQERRGHLAVACGHGRSRAG